MAACVWSCAVDVSLIANLLPLLYPKKEVNTAISPVAYPKLLYERPYGANVVVGAVSVLNSCSQ